MFIQDLGFVCCSSWYLFLTCYEEQRLNLYASYLSAVLNFFTFICVWLNPSVFSFHWAKCHFFRWITDSIYVLCMGYSVTPTQSLLSIFPSFSPVYLFLCRPAKVFRAGLHRVWEHRGHSEDGKQNKVLHWILLHLSGRWDQTVFKLCNDSFEHIQLLHSLSEIHQQLQHREGFYNTTWM